MIHNFNEQKKKQSKIIHQHQDEKNRFFFLEERTNRTNQNAFIFPVSLLIIPPCIHAFAFISICWSFYLFVRIFFYLLIKTISANNKPQQTENHTQSLIISFFFLFFQFKQRNIKTKQLFISSSHSHTLSLVALSKVNAAFLYWNFIYL